MTEIDEICRKEEVAENKKTWLCIICILAAIITAIICVVTIFNPVTDRGEAAALTIIITLSIDECIIISGYFYNRYLSKKLEQLFEQKKLLF